MARRLAASPEPKLTSIKRKAVVISSETTSEADSGHDDDDEDVFVVERIVRSKVENGDKLYEIKWQGYDSDENTWEPAENLNCPELLARFTAKESSNPAPPIPKPKPRPSSPEVISYSEAESSEAEAPPKRVQIKPKPRPAPPKKKRKKPLSDEDEIGPVPTTSKNAAVPKKKKSSTIVAEAPNSNRQRQHKSSGVFPSPAAAPSTSASAPAPLFLPPSPDPPGTSGSSHSRLAGLPSFKRKKKSPEKTDAAAVEVEAASQPKEPSKTPELLDIDATPDPDLVSDKRSTARSPVVDAEAPSDGAAQAGPSGNVEPQQQRLPSPTECGTPPLPEEAPSVVSAGTPPLPDGALSEDIKPHKVNEVGGAVATDVMNIEARLKATQWFNERRHRQFAQKAMGPACAELIGASPELIRRMQGRVCGILFPEDPPADTTAQAMALGYLLAAVGARTGTTHEEIDTIFLHNDAHYSKVSVFSHYVKRRDRNVEFFRYPSLRPIFTHGFLILCTMSALKPGMDVSSRLLDLAREYPDVRVRVHPATLVRLSAEHSFHSLGVVQQLLERDWIVRQKDMPLSSASRFINFQPLRLGKLGAAPPATPPVTSDQHELEEAEKFLVHAHENGRFRRYLLLVSEDSARSLPDFDDNLGIEIVTVSQVEDTVRTSMF